MGIERLIERLEDLKKRNIYPDMAVAMLQELKEDMRSDVSITLATMALFMGMAAFIREVVGQALEHVSFLPLAVGVLFGIWGWLRKREDERLLNELVERVLEDPMDRKRLKELLIDRSMAIVFFEIGVFIMLIAFLLS